MQILNTEYYSVFDTLPKWASGMIFIGGLLMFIIGVVYLIMGIDENSKPGTYYCGRNGYGWRLNDFCSDAERRTDE